MSIKSIKEKELLVNFARAMGQAVDPKLAEEVDRINAIRNSVRASVSENIFKDLGAAVTSSKSPPTDVTIPKSVNYEPDDGPLTEDQLEQIQETVVPEIQFPIPPSLDELLLVLSEEIEEVKNELVQAQPQEESPETETPVSDTPVAEQTIADRTSDFLSKSKDSFQQPDPLKVAPDIDAITKKLRFLEQWISKVSMAGPGGGAVNLKDLDDVSKYSVATATNNQVLSYNAAMKLWVAKTMSSTGGGIALTDLSVISNAASGNGNLTYNDITGVFYFTPADLSRKANITDLTTANVVELTNLYFTNARSVAALTAGSNIIIESNGRISASVNIPTQLQSDWNQTDSGNVEYIKNKPNLSNLEIAANVLAVTHEPMGFEERTDSNISFNDATRTFTISPVASSYNVWVSGTRYTINDTRTVTLPNTTGLYYIYYSNTGALSYKTTFYDWPNEAPTAYVYWNSNVGDAPFIADERHGIVLDWQTHEYLHRTRGAAIANGFDATNYIVGGDGSSNTHLQLDIADGTFFDEDLQVDIVSTNAPTANTWEQDLTGPAKIPMFFLNGSGAWVIDAPTNFPVKQGTRPKFNLYSGGVWTTPDIDNNKFGITFIIATNNINYPIIGIIGQDSHANQGDAEATEFSDLNLTGFPVVEMRPLYKLVYDCKNSYTNSIKARLVSIWDQRSFESTTSAIATYTDHGALSGLLDDDHTQYLLRTDANSVIYSNVISIGYATNSNLALKANIADLKTANVAEVTNLYFTNARAVSAVTNTALSNVTISYTPAINTGYGIIVNAANTQGGTGYADFLKVTNASGGATNRNKSFRLNNTGGIEIINSAYSSTILSITDSGTLNVAEPLQIGGAQAVNGPAFSAYAAAILQTIPNNAQTKVLFQTEEFDTNSNYTNSTFTPTVAGYYQLNAEVRLDGASGTGECMIILYKNGAEYKRGWNSSGTQIASNFWAMTVSSLAYANGTGDYFEIYVQQGSGGNLTVTAVNNSAITWFNGCMLRGA